MDYPLAHDDSGNPIDVPANAAGWLVRRHAGGRGRPAAVYDGDGRPLVMPLESTAAELRSAGCKPGMYRLDAVDAGRRQLEVVAYTEVAADGTAEEADGGRSLGGEGAAVAALARAVEAMQRVQAERERAQVERDKVQAEMIARLVDRLSPPVAQAPRNLRDALGEYGEVQELIRDMAPEDEEEESSSSEPMARLAAVGERVANLAMFYVEQKFGPGKPQVPAGVAANDEVAANTAGDGAADGVHGAEAQGGGEADAAAATKAAVAEKLDAVFALLTEREQLQLRTVSKRFPQAVVEKVLARLVTMTPEQGAAEARRLIASLGVSRGSKESRKKARSKAKAAS